jgi:hypothetical protein
MIVDDPDRSEQDALQHFKERMQEIEARIAAIDSDLSRKTILTLAHRTREAIYLTRDLLDKNVEVLFGGHPVHFQHIMYDHLAYAESHVSKALSEEVDFQAMERRLYLATRLAEHVLSHVADAARRFEH